MEEEEHWESSGGLTVLPLFTLILSVDIYSLFG